MEKEKREMAYCDLHEVFIGDDGLVRLVGD